MSGGRSSNWPRERTTCLLLEIDLEIQSENDLFIFQGYIMAA